LTSDGTNTAPAESERPTQTVVRAPTQTATSVAAFGRIRTQLVNSHFTLNFLLTDSAFLPRCVSATVAV
jgi:hypothetical protein